jgi:hypothetical protein
MDVAIDRYMEEVRPLSTFMLVNMTGETLYNLLAPYLPKGFPEITRIGGDVEDGIWIGKYKIASFTLDIYFDWSEGLEDWVGLSLDDPRKSYSSLWDEYE